MRKTVQGTTVVCGGDRDSKRGNACATGGRVEHVPSMTETRTWGAVRLGTCPRIASGTALHSKMVTVYYPADAGSSEALRYPEGICSDVVRILALYTPNRPSSQLSLRRPILILYPCGPHLCHSRDESLVFVHV
jgi:hypothetical protein